MALVAVKKFGKRAIGYVDNAPPVVDVKHWVSHLSQNPRREVRCDFSALFSSLFNSLHRLAGSSIRGESVPHYGMDYALQ